MKFKIRLKELLKKLETLDNYQEFDDFINSGNRENIIKNCLDYFNNDGDFEELRNFFIYLNIRPESGNMVRQLYIGTAIWAGLNNNLSIKLSNYFNMIKELRK